MKRTGIALCIALLSAGLFSQEQSGGFYGMVQLGGGLAGTTEDQEAPMTRLFSDDPRMGKIDDLGRQDEMILLPLPYVNGVVGYRFEKIDLAIETAPATFMGMPGISLVKSTETVGSFRGSLTCSMGSAWENPYLTGTEREITDSNALGIGAGWEMIMGLPINFSYSLALIDIEDDVAAAAEPLLDRDGRDHAVALSGVVPLSEHLMFFPEVRYELRDRGGAAESADGLGGSLAAMLLFERISTMTAVSYQHAEFDREHPVWGAERKDHTLGITQMVTFPALAGNEKLSLFVMGVWEERFSSIGFYDYRSFVVGSGVEYLF